MQAADEDNEIKFEIQKEIIKFKQKYDPYPKLTMYSCYCVFIYERNAQGQTEVGTSWAENHIIDAYICPLHRSNDKKSSHMKAMAESRKIENRFAGVNRQLTNDEVALLAADREANRKKCRDILKTELAELR